VRDSHLALTLRGEARRKRMTRRDPARAVAIVVVAIMAAVATFALLGAVFDTR
jgi:hypothetical protein